MRVVARKLLNSLCGVGVGRSAFPRRENVSWRTRRMARRKRNVSDLPYAASPLSCVAFFVKEQKGRIEIGSGKGDAALAFTSNLE